MLPHRSRSHLELIGRGTRFLYIGCWGALLVLRAAMEIVHVSRDAIVVRALGAAVLLVAAWFIYRAFLWATIDLYEDSVVIRGLLRTSRVPVSDIDQFMLVQGVDESDLPATALAVRARDGNLTVFSDVSSAHYGSPSVARLVERLNAWITA